MEEVVTADGRTLQLRVSGPDDGLPLVYHSGTPSAAISWPALDRVASNRGVRVLTWSRPGYAGSSEQPGRSVADVAADTATVLDAVGSQDFVTLGWSGGGPHALACAALLPDRCLAAATLAGVAPYEADGLDFLAGMAEENHVEFGAALQGRQSLETVLADWAPALAATTGADVAESFGGLVSAVDQESLTGDLADYVAASLSTSVSTGVAGWRDDDLAFTRPWGFDLDDITVPVSVWQGDEDRMVPFSHGQWLVGHVHGARSRLRPGEGHISLVQKVDEVVADLVSLATTTAAHR